MEDYVYIIKCQDCYKIGKATNAGSRLKELQVGNPYKLELIKVFKVDDGLRFEGVLHNLFYAKNIRGEWFKLTQEDLAKLDSMDTEEFTHPWKTLLAKNPHIVQKMKKLADTFDSAVKKVMVLK